MKKRKLNHCKSRNYRQAKVDRCAWTKMVQNQTVMACNTLQGMDKRFSAYRWLLKHLELFVMQNLVIPLRSQISEVGTP